MSNLRPIAFAGLALLGACAFATEASATKRFTCGIDADPVTISAAYDPFSASGISNQHVNVTFHRWSGSGGTTRRINFYFTQPAGSPGYQILSGGVNVLYTLPASHSLDINNPPSGTVFYDFGQNTQSVVLPFDVTIPPGLDVGPGATISFDVRFVCDGNDDLQPVPTPQTIPDVVTLNINVLSALQASYAGPALDFGEIGLVDAAQAPSHSVSGNVRVASSGLYTVTLSSNAPNPYRLTYPGGSTATAGQYVPYKVRFLGQTKDNASPSFTTVHCLRAGLTGQNLPITATLEDGGQGKAASPSYSDTLSVTVTPVVTTVSPQNCPAL